ncbi:MAG TPA: recombinase family protein [Stellaceae bacterium]|nr:recombinase family protein [Stellaceae bacterium]
MGIRAALYLRVSTGRQVEKDLSIPDQRRQAEAYCKGKSWVVCREFGERGASATDDKRPVFQEMVDAATRSDREFDIIVVHSYSRFFRDAFQFEFYLRRLQKHGVRVVSITQETGDDPTSQLIRKIVSLFDEYQSKENAKHTLRAMKENARQGFWNGSPPPYGYRLIEVERRGDRVKRRLEIDPGEAEIVRRIFRLHLHGEGAGPLGLKAIADHLNRKGIRYRGSRKFSNGLIHRLLTRETYAGRHWFNRRDSKSGAQKSSEEWVPLSVPAIIDDTMLQQARASLSSRSPKVIAPRIVNSPVLLTGLARCATCDGAMTLRTGKSGRYRYYACSTCMRLGTTACKGRALPMAFLDDLVVKRIADRLFTPERLRQLLNEHTERQRTDKWRIEAKQAEKELRANEEATNRLFDMVGRGIAPLDDALGKHLATLRQRREELLRLKAAVERQRAIPRRTIEPHQLGAFCKAMREQLLSADIATRKAYLRLFVERIEVDDAEVRLFGRKDTLETALRQERELPQAGVPSFDQRWRPRGDEKINAENASNGRISRVKLCGEPVWRGQHVPCSPASDLLGILRRSSIAAEGRWPPAVLREPAHGRPWAGSN